MPQGGELPVVSVTTASHCPAYERTPGLGRPEDDGGESRAVTKRTIPNSRQRIWQCEGGESRAVTKRTMPNSRQRIWQCEGGESRAVRKRTIPNSRQCI